MLSKPAMKLATLDIPEMVKRREVLMAKVSRFEAQEQRAKAAVQLASASIKSFNAKVSESKSQLDKSNASIAAATAEFNRTQDLVSRGSVQARLLDEARKKRDSELAEKGCDEFVGGLRKRRGLGRPSTETCR